MLGEFVNESGSEQLEGVTGEWLIGHQQRGFGH